MRFAATTRALGACVLIGLAMLVAASSASAKPPATPVIESFSPASGPVNSQVKLHGKNLASVTTVTLGGVDASAGLTHVGKDDLLVTVPAGVLKGAWQVSGTDGTSEPSKTTFSVTPRIINYSLNQVRGGPVFILGSSLATTSAVTFGGVPAAFTVTCNPDTDDCTLDTTVPATANDGKLTVVTAGGSASVDFFVIVPPTIRSFSPAKGKVGSMVTIEGTNLMWVYRISFGGVADTHDPMIESQTPTKLKVHVPEGAMTGTIAVTNLAGTAVANGVFTVVPTAGW